MVPNLSVLRDVYLVGSLCLSLVSALSSSQVKVFTDQDVKVTLVGDMYKFESDGVPDHEYGPFPNQDNPNTVQTQQHSYEIPAVPNVLSTPGCLPMGTIGLAINGVVLYNPYTAEGYNAVEGDKKEIFDSCDGHPQMNGVYHYHKIPTCLYNNELDKIVGIALDGYLIYGPKDSSGKVWTTKDLDFCHGRTVSGVYRYHMTTDFPYILTCFHGKTLTQQNSGPSEGNPPPPPPGDDGKGGPPPGGASGGDQCRYANTTEPLNNGGSRSMQSKVPNPVLIILYGAIVNLYFGWF